MGSYQAFAPAFDDHDTNQQRNSTPTKEKDLYIILHQFIILVSCAIFYIVSHLYDHDLYCSQKFVFTTRHGGQVTALTGVNKSTKHQRSAGHCCLTMERLFQSQAAAFHQLQQSHYGCPRPLESEFSYIFRSST